MIICKNNKKNHQQYIFCTLRISEMAEAAMSAFGAAVGVLIAMAVVVFGLRGKGHSRAPDA